MGMPKGRAIGAAGGLRSPEAARDWASAMRTQYPTVRGAPGSDMRNVWNVEHLIARQDVAGLKPNAYYGMGRRTDPNYGYIPGQTFPEDALYKNPYTAQAPQANGYYRYDYQVPGSGIPGYNLKEGQNVYRTLVQQGKLPGGVNDPRGQFDAADSYYRQLQGQNQLPPNHFGFGDLLGMALPIAAGFIPGLGPILSGVVGAGAGALGSSLRGGNPLTGAIGGALPIPGPRDVINRLPT